MGIQANTTDKQLREMMTQRQSEITAETTAIQLCFHHGEIPGRRTQVGSVRGVVLGAWGSLLVR